MSDCSTRPFLELLRRKAKTFSAMTKSSLSLIFTGALLLLNGCAHAPRPGTHAPRTGDEIVVAGQFFHIGTPVVLWLDPGGYDAYRVERRFSPLKDADWQASQKANPQLDSPNRYGMRRSALSDWEAEQMRGGGEVQERDAWNNHS